MSPQRYHERLGWLEKISRTETTKRNAELFPDIPAEQLEQFGNQLYISPTYSFREIFIQNGSVEIERVARLLISPEGQQLFRRHHSLLSQFDKALSVMADSSINKKNPPPVNLPNGRMELLSQEGSQAISYHARMGDDDLKIRTIKSDGPKIGKVIQPLYQEMVQIQTASVELDTELKRLGMELPLYYCASGQVAIIRFEPGNSPSDSEIDKPVREMDKILREYIKRKISQDDVLWSSVTTDLLTPYWDIRGNNFIRRQSDNKLVLIDPFRAQR